MTRQHLHGSDVILIVAFQMEQHQDQYPDMNCDGLNAERTRLLAVRADLNTPLLSSNTDAQREAELTRVDGIGFAFPGDLVGLGFLETHTCCARAVTETEVTCLPLEALTSAIGDDPEAQAKLDDAIEREFEFLRSALVEAGRSASIERVAAFLASSTTSSGRR